jgi:spore coat polysaccharide biosynthesis protein SpsF
MITASINARMGSTRLPGKALADINGEPMLTKLLKRVRQADSLDEIVLATTINAEDDQLVHWAQDNKILFHRGSVDDVLKRTVEAHHKIHSDIVVRVCGDTPLIDPVMIDQAVELVEKNVCDIAMSTATRTYPHGVSAHVCKMSDLVFLDKNLTDPLLREHVTLHLYESGGYRVKELTAPAEWDCEGQRLQVDYPEDLEVIRMINMRLGDFCGTEEIVALLRREPWIRGLNEGCEEKPVR